MRATVLLILSSFAATFGYRKSATLTPLNSTVDGAVVTLLRDTTVNTNSDAWEIACTDTNRYWAIEVSLDPSWGFHASLPSNITLRINSDTPTETNTDFDPTFSFSVNRAQYWSTVLNADDAGSPWDSKIGPQCDTNTPPQSSSKLFGGDVKALVDVSTNARYITSGSDRDYWRPRSNIVHFPLQFKIENVPSENLMYVYHIQETYAQKCGFAEAFQGEQGLQIYLHLDNADELWSVQSFEIEYEDDRTSDPSTATPTSNPTISPSTDLPTVSPTTDPSKQPTDYPSSLPTIRPSFAPSQRPTNAPKLLLFSTTDQQESEHSSTIAIKDTNTASQDRQGSDEDTDPAIGKQTQTADISIMVIAVVCCIGVCLPVFICALIYKYWTIMKESSALEQQHVEHDMHARDQKGADRGAVVAAPPNTVDIQLASQGVELQECVQEGQRKAANSNATRKMSEGPKPTSEGVADSVRSQYASSMFKVTSNPLAGDVTVYYNMNAENDEEVIDEEEDAGNHGHTTRN